MRILQSPLGASLTLALILAAEALAGCPKPQTQSVQAPVLVQNPQVTTGSQVEVPADFPLQGFQMPRGATPYQTWYWHWKDRKRPELTSMREVLDPDEKRLVYSVGFSSDKDWATLEEEMRQEAMQFGIQHHRHENNSGKFRSVSWETANRKFQVKLEYAQAGGNVIQPPHDGYALTVQYPAGGSLSKSGG